MSPMQITAAVPEKELQEAAAFINAYWSIQKAIVFEIGRKLLEIKAKLPTRTFMAWVDDNFDFELSTAEKMMQAVENCPDLAQTELVHRKALYLLAQNNTPNEARQLATSLAQQGKPVDYATAHVLAKSPQALRDKLANGEIAAKDAFKVSKVLEKSPRPVQELALATGVKDPAVVDYLTKAFEKYEKLPLSQRENSAWREVFMHKGFLLGDTLVPLSDANGRDVDNFNKQRQYAHINGKRDYLLNSESLLVGEDGCLCIANLPPGAVVKVTVWQVIND